MLGEIETQAIDHAHVSDESTERASTEESKWGIHTAVLKWRHYANNKQETIGLK